MKQGDETGEQINIINSQALQLTVDSFLKRIFCDTSVTI